MIMSLYIKSVEDDRLLEKVKIGEDTSLLFIVIFSLTKILGFVFFVINVVLLIKCR